MKNRHDKAYDVAVIGAGLVGLCAALGIAQQGYKCLIIAPDKPEPDGKTSALMAETIEFIKTLDIWEGVSKFAFPLKKMRIIDGTNRLIRSPQVDFNASEIKLDAFGYNVENKKLGLFIRDKFANYPNLHHLNSELVSIEPGADEDSPYRLIAKSGETVTAGTVIAADGRNSIARADLQIGERTWQYPQIALVGNFSHTLPHNDISTEFHTETGPITLVPLGKNRSSLVCVVDPDGADKISALTPAKLNLALENKMHSILGKITFEGPIKSFPLSGMVANKFSEGAVLFAGEAAHVFPPIGAQGLNLGLRDVAAILELLMKSNEKSAKDIGAKYQHMRAKDIMTRTASVDLLNRSLLSDLLPVQAARSLGLYTLGNVSPLRRLIMREGIAPGSSLANPIERITAKIKPSHSA